MGIVTKADKEIAILRRSRVLSCILLPFGLRPVAPPLKDGRPGGDGARAVPEQSNQLGGHSWTVRCPRRWCPSEWRDVAP